MISPEAEIEITKLSDDYRPRAFGERQTIVVMLLLHLFTLYNIIVISW